MKEFPCLHKHVFVFHESPSQIFIPFQPVYMFELCLYSYCSFGLAGNAEPTHCFNNYLQSQNKK